MFSSIKHNDPVLKSIGSEADYFLQRKESRQAELRTAGFEPIIDGHMLNSITESAQEGDLFFRKKFIDRFPRSILSEQGI